jgi:hypothetical protein
MFVIERIRELPLAMILGLALMAVGGVLEVVIHLGPVDHHAHEALVSAHGAHVVGIAGMALVLAAVVMHGARHQTRRRRAATTQGGPDSNAHR